MQVSFFSDHSVVKLGTDDGNTRGKHADNFLKNPFT